MKRGPGASSPGGLFLSLSSCALGDRERKVDEEKKGSQKGQKEDDTTLSEFERREERLGWS